MTKNTKNEVKHSAVSSLTHRLMTWLKRIFYFCLSAYCLIWLLSPIAARYFLDGYLTPNHGLRLSESSSIRYNPFTSHLTVNQLVILKNDKPVFELTQLNAEIRLHQLLTDTLYVSEFSLQGLNTSLVRDGNKTTVAGMIFPIETKNETKISEANSQGDTVQKSKNSNDNRSNYRVILPHGHMEDISISINENGNFHTLGLGKLNINEFEFGAATQKMLFDLTATLDNAPIRLTSKAELVQMQGLWDLDLKINSYDLKHLSGYVVESDASLSGIVGFSTSQSFQFGENTVGISIPQSKLELDSLRLITQDFSISQKRQTLNVNGILSTVQLEENAKNNDPVTVSSVGYVIEELVLDSGRDSFKSESIDIRFNELTAKVFEEGDFLLELNKVVGAIGSSEFKKDNQLDLNSDGMELHVEKVKFSPEQVKIKSIVVDNLNAALMLFKQDLQEQESISSGDEVKPSDERKTSNSNAEIEKEDSAQESQGLKYSVGQFYLSNPKELSLIDQNVSPNYKIAFQLDKLRVSDLNSKNVNQISPFLVAGTSGEYTNFEFKGTIQPFNPQVNLELEGALNEFPLPPARGYIQSLLGFEFETGELDTILKIKIVDSKIEGSTDLKIRGLNLASAENYDQNLVQEQTAMPLNMALGMLKDSNDNVELDIPMYGDFNSPTFGVASFVSLVTKKAIESTAKSYLLKTFVPYAEVISMTISAGGFILKTRFEDLEFEPNTYELVDSQSTYMQQFIALMKEKENTQVKICATSTSIDLKASELVFESDKEATDFLAELAGLRMKAFKSHSVNNGIDSSRLLLCAPKINLSDDSKPSISISV